MDSGPGPAHPALASSPRVAAPTIGHIGRYALKQPIGEGGLGTVYAAHDPVLSRLVAIKTLNLDIAEDERPALTAMLLHEARAAAGLSHPHIVTVHDAGLSGEGVYIAMELLKGKDLRHLLAEGWRPTPGQAALIVRRVADALAYAHSRGVVHRDIKPANIFMVGRTLPRVLDFGIARIAHQREARDLMAGSPFYMAPEQVERRETDRRTDVFSLGVVLYELLTGERPFQGQTLTEITGAVCTAIPTPAHLRQPEVPVGLSEIAARAMEKDPAQRYSSARSLSRELRHWLDAHPQALNASEDTPRRAARSRATAAAGLGLAFLSAVSWWGWSARTLPETAAGPAPRALQAAADLNTRLQAPASGRLRLAEPKSSTPAAHTPAPMPRAAAIAPPTTQAPRKPLPVVAPKPAAKTAAAVAAAAAPPATAPGLLKLAITPWAHVEVDGKAAGITPPLNSLDLPQGTHTITLRNDGAASRSFTVNVISGQPVLLRHRFGS